MQPENPDADGPKFLEPAEVKLARDRLGRLEVRLGLDECYADAKAVRAFPLTAPGACIAFLDSENREVGFIDDLAELDGKSRQVLESFLKETYFATRVSAIDSVISNHGATSWELQTTRGRCTAHLKDRGDIRGLPGRKVVLTDVNGLKYEIRNIDELDSVSQGLLEAEM